MNTLKEEEPNIDRSIQTVRDLFEMSSKVLDQRGTTGAFHHMIRRKATIAEYRHWLRVVEGHKCQSIGLYLGMVCLAKVLKPNSRIEKNKKISWVIMCRSSTFERPEKRRKVGTTFAPMHSSPPSTSQSNFKGSFQTPGGFKSRTKTEKAEPTVPPFRIPRQKWLKGKYRF